MNRYALEIDDERREFEFFVDALHSAYAAIDQGAMRVLMIRLSDSEPLCVLTPPEVHA